MPILNKNRKVQIGSSQGTGADQTIKHSLGVTPTFVKITPIVTGVTDAFWKSATKTAVVLNVTNAKDYKYEIEA